jgi:uncharacterized phage protein (TIGR01671 family)
MNREIKFRIWNRDAEQWYEPVFEAYKGLLFELLLTTSGELCERSMQGFTHESRFPGKYVIQQYTGLKDKNGKEIYEGDIVQSVYEWETYDGDAYCEKSILKIGEVVFEYGEWRVKDQVLPLYKWDRKTLEVIGNLFENPELLHSEQDPDECDATKAP